jgi:hypothetical protein
VLTRAGRTPSEAIVPPAPGAVAVPREFRLRGPGDSAVVLWRYVGGDRAE